MEKVEKSDSQKVAAKWRFLHRNLEKTIPRCCGNFAFPFFYPVRSSNSEEYILW